MLSLRVLITTYHQAYLLRGGGEYELQTIADGLRQLGIIADIYGPYSRSLDYYDVVLHFSVHNGGLDLLKEISKKNKPIVLWPNLWSNNLSEENATSILQHVQLAEFIIFKSETECRHFVSRLPIPSNKIALGKTTADSSYMKRAPAGLFKELYGINNYALWFGIIEPNKNQLAAIRVLRSKGIFLVLVGRHRDDAYFAECKKVGGDGVLFLEGLPQKSEIVRSALQEADFYIELSHEPPGLSSIEAGLSGCRLLLSESDWTREHFGGLAEYVNPSSDKEISQGVDRLLSRPHDRSGLQKHLINYCFPGAIEPLVDLLKKAAR